MNRITALIEAAKAATPGPWETDQVEHDCPHQDIRIRAVGGGIKRTVCTVWIDDACYDENAQQERNATLIALANPATILELCALLEKAEEALAHINEYWCGNRNDLAMFDACNNAVEVSEEPLAAIKQWKEKADAIRGMEKST